MKGIFILILICISADAFCQNYNVALISDSLKQNADAVKRTEELYVTIKSTAKAKIKHRYAITILNEAGAEQAQYEESYNKMQSLESVSGRLFDATGKELKSVKKKDIGDFSANGEGSLMTDNRIKRHNFYYSQYPYTVEYEDEQEFDGILFLPSWHPVNDTKFSVEQSKFTVEFPADFVLRYKQIVYEGAPVQDISGNKKIYTWQVKNLIPTLREPLQPQWNEINPAVYIAPSQFEIENYKGDMSTWHNLGLFINTLNNNRQLLPENIKQDVHRLTDNIKDPKEKINLLYNYLQQNTRYISIQLGIGGWQPFDATYVATKKYGDCKALSNYMISLLKEAGISARYVLATAGDNKKGLWEDFPSPYFNHVIMCVPQQKDTLWLECTSQTVSPGYMGRFTGNRKVLLIDEDGGHVVTTPAYKASDNLQLRKVIGTVNDQGTLSAFISTHFTGTRQDYVHDLMYGATPDQKKRYLNGTLDIPSYSVEKFEYKETKGIIPSVDEYISLTSPNYATITGKRLFITPNFSNRSSDKLETDKQRKYDIQFYTSFVDADTIQINIPADYMIEAMPKAVYLKSPYGNYSITFSLENNVINVLRKNERNEGRFSKDEYDKIVTYFNDIYKADRSRIVLVKKQG